MKPSLAKITCVEDFFEVYKNQVPKMFFDYCESGSWSEQTFRENKEYFQKIHFRQRVLRDLSNRHVNGTLLGKPVTMPLAISPAGLVGMQHADGEILAAKAALRFGIPYTLSTLSICSIEDIAEATKKPFWFQLYMLKDREFMAELIQRAIEANCDALVLTADLQIMGNRFQDTRNGLSTPPKPTIKNILNVLTKPKWCLGYASTKRHNFGNIFGYAKNVDSMTTLAEWTNSQFDPKLSWKDIEWVKSKWPGKLVIKGILEVDDAKLAVQSGADAIVVSNHGGRQLDGAPPTISVLPEIVEAVGGELEIFMDSGIRSGQDMLKALSLGANGVMFGRPYIYALGSYGEEGVYKLLDLIKKELDMTMAFCGLTNVLDASPAILR